MVCRKVMVFLCVLLGLMGGLFYLWFGDFCGVMMVGWCVCVICVSNLCVLMVVFGVLMRCIRLFSCCLVVVVSSCVVWLVLLVR